MNNINFETTCCWLNMCATGRCTRNDIPIYLLTHFILPKDRFFFVLRHFFSRLNNIQSSLCSKMNYLNLKSISLHHIWIIDIRRWKKNSTNVRYSFLFVSHPFDVCFSYFVAQHYIAHLSWSQKKKILQYSFYRILLLITANKCL